MTDRFYRSKTDRVIGGVASGLAKYWNLDPVIARVLFIIVAMMTGIGFFLYIILWIIIPEEPYPYTNFETSSGFYGPKPETESGKSSDSSQTEENKTQTETKKPESSFEYKYNYENNYKTKSNGGRVTGGIILIAVGLFFLAERIFPYFDFIDFLPLILIGAGLVLILNSKRNKENAI